MSQPRAPCKGRAGDALTGYLDGSLREEHRATWRPRMAEPSVDNLHVRPGRTGTGIGYRLLRRGFAWAAGEHPGRDVFLEVLRGNAAAIAFYERAGGLVTAERSPAIADGIEADEIEYTWTATAVGRLAALRDQGGQV